MNEMYSRDTAEEREKLQACRTVKYAQVPNQLMSGELEHSDSIESAVISGTLCLPRETQLVLPGGRRGERSGQCVFGCCGAATAAA